LNSKKGKCNKSFPKEYCENTSDGDDSFPVYKRPENGQKFWNATLGVWVDSKWVVPHNLYLVTKYDCHINVEICSSVQAVKYLYKYIYKGSDKAMTKLEPVQPGTKIDIDEIKEYADSQYVSAIEGVWHIMHNAMHGQDPPVNMLDCHLLNCNNIVFDDMDSVQEVLKKGLIFFNNYNPISTLILILNINI